MNIIDGTLAWLAFYGSAGFGWVLFMSLPGVVATSRTLNARRIIHNLRAKQDELAEEWDLKVKGKETEENSPEADEDDGAFDTAGAAG